MKVTILAKVFSLAVVSTLIACAAENSANTSTTKDSIDDQATSLDWIDDAALRQRVIDYAKAGQPVLVDTDGEECYSGYAQLGGSDYCFEPVKLPGEVLKDIITMNAQRFENDSDYDQRITKLYAFRHWGNYGTYVDKDEALGIADALQIPADMTGAMTEKLYDANDLKFLGILEGLFINGKYHEKTTLHAFVADMLKDQKAKVFTFGPDEIGLYPGGGFGISFMIIMTDRDMIYIKNEGWNA